MEFSDRFCLLHLEPGEFYFEDYGITLELLLNDNQQSSWRHTIVEKQFRGRLKVCSKSLIFDPRDIRIPIIKIPLKGCEEISKVPDNLRVELEEKGRIEPYQFFRSQCEYKIKLLFVEISSVLPLMCQLHRASTLPADDQNVIVQSIFRSRQLRAAFDVSNLNDISEKSIYETSAFHITPLCSNPGIVLLTDKVLYFQSYNNAEKGLEVFYKNTAMNQIFFIFKEAHVRADVYENLLNCEELCLDDCSQSNIQYQWQAGAVSNYEYLMYLNSEADRTVNDLTQYPVFPWVLNDYSSKALDLSNPSIYRDLMKPVGALNETRLLKLKERLKYLPEPKFLYGSHYSTPAFVVYYLVRKYPRLMLTLQSGKFDHPDRTFNSVLETWEHVANGSSDFKELIPEFYNVDDSEEFLINVKQVYFGRRQNGKDVSDVELPLWASGPKNFIEIMRDALESDFVSQNIHHWIDLIFGYKQRGEEAIKADNVDIMEITDLNTRLALEVQIMEFGQIPKQLFTQPHPPKSQHFGLCDYQFITANNPNMNFEREGNISRLPTLWQNLSKLEAKACCIAHSKAITDVCITLQSTNIVSVGKDSLFAVFSANDLKQVRTAVAGQLILSSCVEIPESDSILIGSWDNSVYKYSFKHSCVLEYFLAHGDAISTIHWANNILVTGSLDCTARVWSLPCSINENFKVSDSFICQLEHDTPVTRVLLNTCGNHLATATEDGLLASWYVPQGIQQCQLKVHNGPVTALKWGPLEKTLLTCGSDGFLCIVDTANGLKVCSSPLHEPLTCIVWDGRMVLAGSDSGDLIIYDMGCEKIIRRLPYHDGPVNAIALFPNCCSLVTAGEDKKLVIWGIS